MSSNFDKLYNMVVERAESTIRESANKVVYGLNPEFDPSGLTGFDKLAANFVEEKPATSDEIIDVIQRNSEDPENRNAALDVFKNLVDSNILVPTSPTEPETAEDGEPDAAALEKEPEVEVEPTAPVVASTDEEEDEEDDSTPVPAADKDEEDTFAAPEVTSGIENTANTDEEDVDDDTPASVLLKREQEKKQKKRAQLSNLVKYMFQKRGKSPEEADAYLQQAAAKGLV